MGVFEILGFAIPIFTKFLQEWNILGSDDKNKLLEEGGQTLEALISALSKVRNGETADLSELKLTKTLDQVLSEKSQPN